MFGKLYLGELKKLNRPKGLIAISIIFVVFFVIFAMVYNLNFDAILEGVQDMFEDMDVQEEFPFEEEYPFEEEPEKYPDDYDGMFDYDSLDYIAVANPDNIDKIIEEFTAKRNEYKKLAKKEPAYGSMVYYSDCALSMLNYMKENNVYGENLNVVGYTQHFFEKTAENFALTYFEFVLAVLAIYGIVIASGLLADEYSKGTIKLLMLRPIGKNELTTAKLLALFTHLVGILGIASLIGYIYGAIAFKSTSLDKVFVVFNAKSVFTSTAGAVVFYNMFFKTVALLSTVTLSYAIGTVTKRKTLGIILTLIIDLGIVSAIFSIFGGSIFLFSTNTDFSQFFGFSTNMEKGANFFISLPVYIAYMAVILSTLYVTVKKRDII